MSTNAAEVTEFRRIHGQAIGLAAEVAPLDITAALGYPYVSHRVMVEATEEPPTIIETELRFEEVVGATLVDKTVTRFSLKPDKEGAEPQVVVTQEIRKQRRPAVGESPQKAWERTDELPLRGFPKGRALYRLRVGLDSLVVRQNRIVDAERSPLEHMSPDF